MPPSEDQQDGSEKRAKWRRANASMITGFQKFTRMTKPRFKFSVNAAAYIGALVSLRRFHLQTCPCLHSLLPPKAQTYSPYRSLHPLVKAPAIFKPTTPHTSPRFHPPHSVASSTFSEMSTGIEGLTLERPQQHVTEVPRVFHCSLSLSKNPPIPFIGRCRVHIDS